MHTAYLVLPYNTSMKLLRRMAVLAAEGPPLLLSCF